MSNNYQSCIERLNRIRQIPHNWDGYEACQPSGEAIDRCIRFLERLNQYKSHLLQYLNAEDIFPMPYGTVVMNFERKDKIGKTKCFSFEVGKTKSDYFMCFN